MKKMMTKAVLAALGLGVASAALADVSVQLNPDNPTISPVGANSAVVQVTFSGDGVATSYSGAIQFNDAEFDITTVTSVDATCSAPVDEDGAGNVTLTFSDGAASALPNGVACTFIIDHVGAGAIVSPYTFAALNATDIDDNTVTITGSPLPNDVTVTAGPPTAPTIAYAPSPVVFPAGSSFPTNVDVNVTPTATGGLNGGSTSVSCTTSSPGFSIPTSATVCTDNTCAPTPLVFRCAQTNATQSGTAACTATPTNPAGSAVVTNLTLTCPAANVAPTLTYAPVPSTPITMPTVGQGQTSNNSIAVTPSLGSGTSTSTVGNCAFSSVVGAAFTAPTGTLTFAGSTTSAQNLNFSCVAPTNGQPDGTATLTCDQTIGSGAATQVSWPVTCPDGNPVAAPSVIYTPAAGPITFPQAATLGASTAGAPTINIDITGGADDSLGDAETTSVSCTVPAGFTLTGSPVGPIGVGDPTPDTDGTIAVSCVSAAAPQAGNMTCTASQSVNGVVTTANTLFALDCPAAAVNVSAAPAEGTVTLSGAPGTQVPGTITVNSLGSASTLTCTVGGSVTAVSALSQPIPAAPGSVAFAYTCLTGSAGAANVGTISCTTGDTIDAADATLDYTVNCAGIVDVPVPAISDLGKILMAALVIGFGLLGLGVRRQ
jgi:hypothetical protein